MKIKHEVHYKIKYRISEEGLANTEVAQNKLNNCIYDYQIPENKKYWMLR